MARIETRGAAEPGRKAKSRPRKNAQRYLSHDPLPIAPQGQLREVIRAHDPNKAHTRVTRLERVYCLSRVARAQPCLKIADNNAGVVKLNLSAAHALRERRGALRFKGVARAHKTPNLSQPKAGQSAPRQIRMGGMGGIERAPKKANRLAGSGVWKTAEHGPIGQRPARLSRRRVRLPFC